MSRGSHAAVALRVPGDKSIAHRGLILAALGPEAGRVRGLPTGEDVRRTASALAAAGIDVSWPRGSTEAVLTPPGAWRARARIECGNSGTTARLLTGLFAGLGLAVELDGDESLRKRPMDRVVYPLQAMGARIAYVGETDRLPIALAARATGALRVLRYRSRVASAQVKSALVLAALTAEVEFEMWEPARSRDHTERLLASLGVPIDFGPDGGGAHLHLPANARTGLRSVDLTVPGDPSSAAFLLAAGLLAGRDVDVTGLLLNETRTAFLEVMEALGADVEVEAEDIVGGESVGRVGVRSATLAAVDIGPDRIPALVDEIPVLAVLAARAAGDTLIRGAEELRVKESDRIAALVDGLRAVGFVAEERPDGLVVRGDPGHVPSGEVRTRGDHRIAMAFAALRAVPGASVRLDDEAIVTVSYPEFWDDLARVVAG